ncbi:aminopeptidase [archaeon]|nr:MAG: aminopeptidase [archaeon]
MDHKKDDFKLRRESLWNSLSDTDKKEMETLVTHYKRYLDEAKTEREAVRTTEAMARERGFIPLDELEKKYQGSDTSPAGERFYVKNKEKNILLGIMGTTPLSQGFSLIASHVDSPRLDLKPNPLIEKEKFTLLKTHYYGGMKKYQFASIPLALHGVVYMQDGKRLRFTIGEDEDDPVFTVNDILIHLAKQVQYERKTPDVIKGEELNILFSSIPYPGDDTKEAVKRYALALLNERYGLAEEDFVSAEIEAVPAGRARDVGIDRSMIGAYGQDDRICAFTSVQALFELEHAPAQTALVLLADKEEIGSEGSTSMQSSFFSWIVARLLALSGEYRDLSMLNAFMNARALSADVAGGINPNFPDVHEHNNAPRLGYGIALTKYTGKSGKYNANDANAEYVSHIRSIFNAAGVRWQAAELGKVDEGGGGTVAKFLSKLGIETIDSGPPVLSMHSSFEVSSKVDLLTAKRAYRAFLDWKKT